MRQDTVVIVQNPPSDALSSILRSVNAEALCSIRLEAGGRWAVDFPMPRILKFNVVRRGQCWLMLPGEAPIRLSAGDCIVVSGAPFQLASDLDVPPVSARDVFANGRSGQVGDNPEFAILGGSVYLDTVDGVVLTGALPPVFVIASSELPQAAWLLDQLDQEWRSGAPGSRLICNDLLRLAFIHVLRAHMAREAVRGTGWLAGLTDRHLAPVLEAVHAEPARDWTVAELARIAGQSRSGFAAHFRERVGVAPIDYVAQWRMRMAAAQLRRSDLPISRIAHDLGYATDSAFSATFRRIIGTTPRRYRADASASEVATAVA